MIKIFLAIIALIFYESLYLYLKGCKGRNPFSMEMKIYINQINETLLMINENKIIYTI